MCIVWVNVDVNECICVCVYGVPAQPRQVRDPRPHLQRSRVTHAYDRPTGSHQVARHILREIRSKL
jgi:hypothetical protein